MGMPGIGGRLLAGPRMAANAGEIKSKNATNHLTSKLLSRT